MLVFPNAKINIGLFITEKRKDGFHNLESIFHPVNLCDVLEITETEGTETTLINSGIPVDGKKEDNLCYKAWELLHKNYKIPAVNIHLYKKIPFGAGLGGGSSDASSTLLVLQKLFQLTISEEKLNAYAEQLGSDCPFFLKNKTAYALLKGEKLIPMPLDFLKHYYIAIIHPGISINTKEAYASITANPPSFQLSQINELPISEWKYHLRNDFEKNAFSKFPELERIKKHLYEKGALYASMTGSGSAIVGFFEQQPDLKIPQAYFQYIQEPE